MKQMSFKSLKRQAGVSILQVMIGIIVAAVALIALVNSVTGQRSEAQINDGVSFGTTELTTALSSYYYSSGRDYTKLSASATAAGVTTGTHGGVTTSKEHELLVQRFGLRTEMPWTDPWDVSNLTANSMTVTFPCTNIGDGTTQTARCNQLRESIAAANVNMISACAVSGATTTLKVTCTYSRPQ